jgi:hypothetical protein
MSSFDMPSIAAVARLDLVGSASPSSPRIAELELTCHDRPYRSFSQPHRLGSPPSVSFDQ